MDGGECHCAERAVPLPSLLSIHQYPSARETPLLPFARATAVSRCGAPADPFAGVREHLEGERAAVKRLVGGALCPSGGVFFVRTARLADARPDREERRGRGGATFAGGISFPSFLC